ncbi:MAG: uracil-DNA glycosylase [Acidobacteriota bacterium]|nr:uracil-DNA glycosylase [Acidobacteriota bacterium]
MNLEFLELERRIVECRRCPRLVEWREAVARRKTRRFRTQHYWGRPVPAFGSPDAALVIIGLAPAAHGGNRTGRIFTGDRSGDWLYEALYRFGFANQPTSVSMDDGLRIHNCLITAVIRCAPPDNKPLPEEVARCRDFICRELQLASRKRVVVALGRIAFEAFLKTRLISGDPPLQVKPTFRHGGEWELPGRITLITSYHPSQQNTQTGKLTRSMFYQIFDRARSLLPGDR